MKPALEKIIKTLNLQELVEAQAEIQDIITEKQDEEKERLREAFEQMASQSGLSVEDILGIVTTAPTNTKQKKSKKPPVEPKYRNPEDENETWSGRGRHPIWVQDFLASHDWHKGDDKDTMYTILEEVAIEEE